MVVKDVVAALVERTFCLLRGGSENGETLVDRRAHPNRAVRPILPASLTSVSGKRALSMTPSGTGKKVVPVAAGGQLARPAAAESMPGLKRCIRVCCDRLDNC